MGAALLWGTTGTAQALGPAGASPLAVGTARLAVGAAGLAAAAALRGRLRPVGDLPLKPLVVAGLGVAVYQPLFFAAVDRAGVALGTVVAIGSGPVAAGVLSWALDGWKPTARWTAATTLALVGVALIVRPGSGGSPAGVILALGAGASYAAYAVASKRILQRLSPLGAMAWVFGAGALLLVPLLFVVDLSWLLLPDGILMAAWLGLAATTLAYVLFGHGLSSTPVASAVTLSLAEPLTAASLGVVVLGERPEPLAWLGAGCLVAGLLLVGTEVQA